MIAVILRFVEVMLVVRYRVDGRVFWFPKCSVKDFLMGTVSRKKHVLNICGIVSLALVLASCAKEEVSSYSIGTGGVQGSYLVVGSVLATIVNEQRSLNGFQLQHEPSSGSVSNIDAIAAGDNQFGIAQADHLYHAVKGLGEWSDKGPQGDLRAVFGLYSESVTLVVGGDSDLRSVGDLRGKLVDIGSPGSGTRENAIEVLRAAGIDWRRDIQAREGSVDERLAKFTRGELDAFFATVGHPNMEVKFATVSAGGARLIPITEIQSLVEENSYFSKTSIPARLYPMATNEADVETIGVNATLVTSAKMPDEVVYAVTKAVFENVEALAEFNAVFDALLSDYFLEGLTAPIHPGALRYYEEAGLIDSSRSP